VVTGHRFDAMAFIDVCGRIRAGLDESAARTLQRIEMALLLEESLEAVSLR
jgi:hypothetical protein